MSRQRRNYSRNLPLPLKVETSSFLSRFHKEICQVNKYKIHSPSCSCNVIKGLRADYHQQQRNSGSSGLEEQMGRLMSDDPFDNLVVVPDKPWGAPKDWKPPRAVFVCDGTSSSAFPQRQMAFEKKLAKEIFEGTNTSSFEALPFSLSCASCLLAEQQNGFMAIVTDSLEEVQPTITKAREMFVRNVQATAQLHSDHAHFICAVKLSSCNSLLSAKVDSPNANNNKEREVTPEIIAQLRSGGVKLRPYLDDASFTIKLGHHLTSLLKFSEGKSTMSQYCLVLGYIDGHMELSLDLPGGKRNPGESTLEGLVREVREVREEISLELDKRWLSERISHQYGGELDENCEHIQALVSDKWNEKQNVYFVLSPPPLRAESNVDILNPRVADIMDGVVEVKNEIVALKSLLEGNERQKTLHVALDMTDLESFGYYDRKGADQMCETDLIAEEAIKWFLLGYGYKFSSEYSLDQHGSEAGREAFRQKFKEQIKTLIKREPFIAPVENASSFVIFYSDPSPSRM